VTAALRALIVDDDPRQGAALRDLLVLEGIQAEALTTPAAVLQYLEDRDCDVVLSDLQMPGMTGLDLYRRLRATHPHVVYVLITAYGSIPGAVEAVKEGVFHYLTKPVAGEELLEVLRKAGEVVSLRRENLNLRREIEGRRGVEAIIGRSPGMSALRELIRTVAPSDSTILIRGDSGTGKELVADALHVASRRFGRPLVKVNCAAVPENLMEDELFGHERGAFTGASALRRGRFEQAHGGTLFLDEIGEMPGHLQAKLLRVVQDRTFERLGGSVPITVDVRVISATNRDLEALVREGRFREDLYYRLNVIPILVPPLRERPGDLALLAAHFLARFSLRVGKPDAGLAPAALRHLEGWPWPGNVRELQNVIERAVVLAKGDALDVGDLPLPRQELRPAEAGGGDPTEALLERLLDREVALEEIEKSLIRRALERMAGHQEKAARLLGLSRRTLQYRAGKFGMLNPAPDEEEEP
jgi:two-component system NtrC family response regulator